MSFGSSISNNISTGYVADTSSTHGYDDEEDDNDEEQQSQSNKIGELSFVCVSHAGEVFVYIPIKLLLGIEEGDFDEKDDGVERDTKHELEKVSSFFFGKELFHNLQHTWKPLAEPSTRIHLSVFEHDIQQ